MVSCEVEPIRVVWVVSTVTGETGDDPGTEGWEMGATGELPGADDPGAVVGPTGVFGTGTTVVETGMLIVLRLVEFSKETVLTEVVKIVEVAKLWVDVMLAELIELVVELQGTAGTPVPEVRIEVVLAELRVVVALADFGELRMVVELADPSELVVVLQRT
jgi:hypothetical protein